MADNLSRALEATGGENAGAAEPAEQLGTLLEGVRMTEGQLQAAFRQHNIVRYGEVGEAFDPHLHDALFEVAPEAAPPGLAPGSIAHLLKAGYELNGRVIRPAQVGTMKQELDCGVNVDVAVSEADAAAEGESADAKRRD